MNMQLRKMYLVYLTGLSFCVFVLSSCQSSGFNRHIDYTDYETYARQLVGQMTLDEKVGQMIQAESSKLISFDDVETYCLGSILSGAGADPEAGNGPGEWAGLYERLQSHAMNTRLKIPLLYGIDAVHGHSNVVGAVIFPHNIGLGCSRNPELVERIAEITAKEMRGTGINWTFAPCVTVPQDERWGRHYEGFSEDPKLVSVLGAAAVRGYQGKSLNDSESVLACAKHYVGDGGTSPGTSPKGTGWDRGDTQVDEESLRDVHLYPYIKSINMGVGSIMPSYSSWNGVKCSANKYLLTTILKEELGFEGFLISDYEAIEQIDPVYEKTEKYNEPGFKEAIAISINAGMDMAMVPSHYRQFHRLLKESVLEGKVPMSRIDDAVTRIMRVKIAMGLMDEGYDYRADLELQKQIGCEEHRNLARRSVRESLVLLKNENKVLPLSKNLKRIHVSGAGADDIGYQCGGWTIDWQGKTEANITEGTTLLEAVRQSVRESTSVTYSKDGFGADGADVGIVVIGEKPYAEYKGDKANVVVSPKDVQTVRNMKAADIPVVVVLYSGRPIILDPVLDEADVFVAAWLPGTEGQGISDVLFGDYHPVGKLSFAWPKSLSQIPIGYKDKGGNPLFEYGFGLGY